MLFADAVILLLQGVDLIQYLGVGLFQCLLVKRHIVALGQLPIQLLHLGIQFVQLLDVRQKGLLLRFRQGVGAADKRRLIKVCKVVVVGQGVADFVQLFPQRRVSLEDGVALLFHRLDLLPDGVLILGGNFSNRLHWCGCGGKGGGCRADGRYHQCQCQCKAQNRFLFHGMLRSFLKYFWLSFNLVCSIPEAALKFPRESAGKVSQKCNETSPENERKPSPRLKGRNGRTFLSKKSLRRLEQQKAGFYYPVDKADHFLLAVLVVTLHDDVHQTV